MTDFTEIRSATESLAVAFEQFKAANDERLAAIEKTGSVDAVVTEKIARLDAQIHDLQSVVSGVKTALRRPGMPSIKALDGVHSEAKVAFLRYVAKGETGDWQRKSLHTLSDPDGGYLVPAEISQRIITRQFDTTPLRQLATVMNISSDAVEMLRDTEEAEAQWVNEIDSRADTEQGQIGRVRISVHELHAQPKATQKLLDDASVNVEEWLVAKIADRFARRENAAFVNGDGVGQPRGFTSYSTAATADGSRAWGVLEHVLTGQSAGFASSTPADKLIELMYRLKAGYLPHAAWLMPRSVAELIRKFKENTTQAYIWQPGLQAGQPATLFGYPVYLAEDMPALGAGSLSLAFGNFAEGYTIAERQGMQILRDPYTAAPFVKFRATKRVGGDVTNFDAIKLLKFSN